MKPRPVSELREFFPEYHSIGESIISILIPGFHPSENLFFKKNFSSHFNVTIEFAKYN
jgi:hypothetical protein